MIYSKNDLKKASKFIIKNCKSKNYLFKGKVGAGKTTLIKELCLNMNVEDNVNSPTFSIINEYLTNSSNYIYHMDLFRLVSENEVNDLGIIEYSENDDIVIIEWPEIILNKLNIKHYLIEIDYVNENKRKLTITNKV